MSTCRTCAHRGLGANLSFQPAHASPLVDDKPLTRLIAHSQLTRVAGEFTGGIFDIFSLNRVVIGCDITHVEVFCAV